MNIIRNQFREEVEALKPLLRAAYLRIQEFQEERLELREKRMREAIGSTLSILSLFKGHIPAYKQKYIELLETQEQLEPSDLIICFDRAVYELHTRVKSGHLAKQPWSQTLRDLLNERQEPAEPSAPPAGEVFLASGQGVSRGSAEGPARIVRSQADFLRVRPGDILIAPMTEPDFIAVAPLIAGLVTDRGGMLCHAAILAREFQIPCIVGCMHATETIADGRRIRMDAVSGIVMGAE